MITQDTDMPVETRNLGILEALKRGDVVKVAQAGSAMTRTQLREESVAMKFLPSVKAEDSQLTPGLDERLQFLEVLEPDSPGAKWVPFQTVPDGEYLYGSKYIMPVARIVTPLFEKDIDELRAYPPDYDLRKMVSQNSIKDGLAAYDGKVIETMTAIVQDTAGGVPGRQAVTGKVQWMAAGGGLNKYNLVEAFKMLPRGNLKGKFRLRNHVMVMNECTAQDLKKLDVNEIGDENVSKQWREGLTSDAPMSLKFITTIKDDLIPDNRVWFLTAPEFLGKAKYLQDWTMFMKKEAFFVSSFAHWLGGFAFGNIAGVCVFDFDAS